MHFLNNIELLFASLLKLFLFFINNKLFLTHKCVVDNHYCFCINLRKSKQLESAVFIHFKHIAQLHVINHVYEFVCQQITFFIVYTRV